jgi:hypothetical protein
MWLAATISSTDRSATGQRVVELVQPHGPAQAPSMVRSLTWVRLRRCVACRVSSDALKFRARWRVVDVHGEDEFAGLTVVLDGATR